MSVCLSVAPRIVTQPCQSAAAQKLPSSCRVFNYRTLGKRVNHTCQIMLSVRIGLQVTTGTQSNCVRRVRLESRISVAFVFKVSCSFWLPEGAPNQSIRLLANCLPSSYLRVPRRQSVPQTTTKLKKFVLGNRTRPVVWTVTGHAGQRDPRH
jgi:hypothetical protein